MASQPENKIVALHQIYLNLENPRHEPYETEAEVIDYLCRNEDILPLAWDIAEYGLNPIEPFALIPDELDKDDAKSTYFVAEGNRRICALILLSDPDRAPTKLAKSFRDAAKAWGGISNLACVVFEDRETVDPWLTRIHDGQQGGIGRKKWSSDQSQRHSGSPKNKLALHILDYAEENGLISKEERKGKLTTATRYLKPRSISDALGLEISDLDNIKTTKSKNDFDALLEKFVNDLKSGHINSRAKGEATFDAYARELSGIQQSGAKETAPRLLRQTKNAALADKMAKRRRTTVKPRSTVPFDHAIMDGLKSLDNQKLVNLYNSITSVPLQPHAPLVSIGAWAFLESLSANAGRNSQTDFLSFFGKSRLQKYGVAKGKGDKAITEALRRLSASGDVTKHDGTASLFNGEQLANDMETLNILIQKCIEEITSNQ